MTSISRADKKERFIMMKKKSVIAMSGGVDSSVAALLTKEEGDQCIGVTMKLFDNQDIGEIKDKACCSLEDAEDARRVAFKIGIPHYVFNFTDRFRQEVMDRFAEAYLEGKTPNPCIDCNRYLKFDRLLKRMYELRYDYIVTGHYARIDYDLDSGRYLLKKALDPNKDQSYVLYTLTQEQLSHIKFPLGSLTKDQVRKIAEEHGFVNAKKHDSQDICFVPDGDYAKFIELHTGKTTPAGDFVDAEGNVLGEHRGIIHYTIGQRRGLRLPAKSRLYVCRICPEDNKVVLGKNEDLFATDLVADHINLISCENLYQPKIVQAKIRYRHQAEDAVAWQTPDDLLHVRFVSPQRAITPGQAVVLYDGDIVVGGAVIKEAQGENCS